MRASGNREERHINRVPTKAMTAAPRITRASIRRNAPRSCRTRAVIPADVATKAAAMNIVSGDWRRELPGAQSSARGSCGEDTWRSLAG